MFNIEIKKHTLNFKFEAGTSRGVLKEKDTWFIIIKDPENPTISGIGECGPLKGLSPDDVPDFKENLEIIIREKLYLNLHHPVFDSFPSIRFGFETAIADLHHNGQRIIFDNNFVSGSGKIPINGLIWMGSKDFLQAQIEEKISAGYTCLKLKIGSLDFGSELEVLAYIRKKYSEDIIIRLDANGAFNSGDCLLKLNQISRFKIHSIEQPIKPDQIEVLEKICRESPVPVALDEELISVFREERNELLNAVKPSYLILKPTLLGGFQMCDEWINLAEEKNIGWWLTSALESNVGLNAISQYTYEKLQYKQNMPFQGLGTGSLYHNNISSPLKTEAGFIIYDKAEKWGTI